MSLADAPGAVEAGHATARDMGSPSDVAVVDAGGRLLAFARMDEAWRGGIAVAIDTAFASRALDGATEDLAPLTQPGGPFLGIHVSDGGRVMVFAGALPLKVGDLVVGAIGVSGGTGEQDQPIAEIAAPALRG